MASLYDMLIAAGVPKTDIDHHASDLYVRATPLAKLVLQLYTASVSPECRPHPSEFRDQIEGTKWYDIPFHYPLSRTQGDEVANPDAATYQVSYISSQATALINRFINAAADVEPVPRKPVALCSARFDDTFVAGVWAEPKTKEASRISMVLLNSGNEAAVEGQNPVRTDYVGSYEFQVNGSPATLEIVSVRCGLLPLKEIRPGMVCMPPCRTPIVGALASSVLVVDSLPRQDRYKRWYFRYHTLTNTEKRRLYADSLSDGQKLEVVGDTQERWYVAFFEGDTENEYTKARMASAAVDCFKLMAEDEGWELLEVHRCNDDECLTPEQQVFP